MFRLALLFYGSTRVFIVMRKRSGRCIKKKVKLLSIEFNGIVSIMFCAVYCKWMSKLFSYQLMFFDLDDLIVLFFGSFDFFRVFFSLFEHFGFSKSVLCFVVRFSISSRAFKMFTWTFYTVSTKWYTKT